MVTVANLRTPRKRTVHCAILNNANDIQHISPKQYADDSYARTKHESKLD